LQQTVSAMPCELRELVLPTPLSDHALQLLRRE
jgi:hypothetical protein